MKKIILITLILITSGTLLNATPSKSSRRFLARTMRGLDPDASPTLIACPFECQTEAATFPEFSCHIHDKHSRLLEASSNLEKALACLKVWIRQTGDTPTRTMLAQQKKLWNLNTTQWKKYLVQHKKMLGE